MAGQKFTPYALTALPTTANRDVYGIYFIRNAIGFKIYLIANTPTKDAVEIDISGLSGFVDLVSAQTIGGYKKFESAILFKEDNQFPIVSSTEMAVQMCHLNSKRGMHILANTNKAFFIDLSDLNIDPTQLRVVPLSAPAPDGKGGETYANYLGFKRVFEFKSSLSLSNSTGLSFNTLISTSLKGWDDGEALAASGGNWDITWATSSVGTIYHSLKSTFNTAAQVGLTIRVSSSNLYLVGRKDGVTTTIPTGAKLSVW